MIYTVGIKEVYEDYIDKDENPRKLGACEGYTGGSVWRTYEEAETYLKRIKRGDMYSIYGVIADWEKDTAPSEFSWNSLLVTSKLVRIKRPFSAEA